MQAPLERNGVLVPLQVTHWELDGPEHVPHEAWHGSQTPLVLAYLPTGMQDARQLPRRVPSWLKNGVAAEHEVQSLAVVPSQSAQVGGGGIDLTLGLAPRSSISLMTDS